MSQSDVYEFLKDNKGEKFTTKEISDLLEMNRGSISMNCRRLRKDKFVKYEKGGSRGIEYTYWVVK